jgi:small-conductance mechanosensitive channel
VFWETLRQWLSSELGLGLDAQHKLLISLAVILVIWLVHRLLAIFVIHRIEETETRYQWQKVAGYSFSITGILIVSLVWVEGIQSAATYLGLLSAGIAIALKDPITNIIAWAFILWRKPFTVGDRIQIGEFAGDVIDQRVFQFTLMEIGNWVQADQATGRILHVPNGTIFTATLANYTKGSDYIWNEIPVLVTFESDWKKAKQILQQIVTEHTSTDLEEIEKSFNQASKRFLLKYNVLTPAVFTSVEASGVLLTLRYLCKPRKRRISTELVWEEILNAFEREADLDFAYPTQRFYTLPDN